MAANIEVSRSLNTWNKLMNKKTHQNILAMNNVTFLYEPSIKSMCPLSTKAKTLVGSNWTALSYDCFNTKISGPLARVNVLAVHSKNPKKKKN